jgi:hypothetical protein
MMPRATSVLIGCCFAAVVACGDGSARRDPAPATTIDTIGDTIRVRTGPGAARQLRLEPEVRIGTADGDAAYLLGHVSAIVEGPAGGIYIWDDRLSELRLYDSAGVFVRTLGRKGQGPGEYVDAAGIASTPRGGVALWDPQTGRFTVFEADGTVRTSWRWASSMIFAPHRLSTDAASNIYVPTLLPSRNASGQFPFDFAYTRVRPDGGIVDTVLLPAQEETPMLRAHNGPTSTGEPLPFVDRDGPLLTPWGTLGRTYAGRYTIDIPQPSGRMLRIEREIETVPVGDEERRDLAEAITREMRKVDPTWRWSGPEIPRTKPMIRGVVIERDGGLRVARSMPAVRQPPSDTTPGAPDKWVEPSTYDIFAPTGHLIGEVTFPPSTTPHLGLGDRVWAVQHDSLDVPTIVRFRVRDR